MDLQTVGCGVIPVLDLFLGEQSLPEVLCAYAWKEDGWTPDQKV